ncbi:conjugal transfer nickase/helicase TraI [Klebsiella pneumoniae]|uniref:Conjugal transfer nickase/helicase TraI n=1 Tax=Klebsiella pneumoniae TaxID=573 RepID=A0A2X3IRQ2_KLEPN|nr:conjugal transfer nickase/helicase TraI [Klebsiella pneumoniae]
MRSAGVDAQTLASFLHDTQLQQRSGETPDFSNTLFLLDESSMVGNTDMARAYALIAAGGGRAVASGDTDQLQAIAPVSLSGSSRRAVLPMCHHEGDCASDAGTAGAVYSLINRMWKGHCPGLRGETVSGATSGGRMGTGALRDGVQSQPGSETGRSAAEGDAESEASRISP